MAVVDLGSRTPEGLRWTLGKGLGLAYHIRGAGAWTALPLAIAGPGRDLPAFVISQIHPVSPARVQAPAVESIWLAGGGRRVCGLAVAPDGFLRFASNDGTERLAAKFSLSDCLRANRL